MAGETILVVDDEPPVRHALRDLLERNGWVVREAATIEEMTREVETGAIDLVTLDLELGDELAFDEAQVLRANNTPVVIVSGHGHPSERAQGLEAGADDYILKPFDSREVVIRIGRVLDRHRARPVHKTMQFDHSTVDLARGRILHNDGRCEDLTGLEAKLLELFLARPAQVLSRDDINRVLHGRDWSPYDRTIDGHVARLRRKFEPKGEAPTLIRSVRGVGYMFTADPKPSVPDP